VSGVLWTPFGKAAELLAASAEFQAMTGAANATAALAKVVYPSFYTPGADSIPLAVLWKHSGHTRTRRTWDGTQEGSLLLTLFDAIPEANLGEEKTDYAEWTQRVDDIFTEMQSLARTAIPGSPTNDWYFDLKAFEELDPPGWVDEAATGVAHARTATYRLEWGGGL
jgi:hypothetical protein